ncbi:Tetratricopeptide repeat protein 17 [Geodia barretti]|nr:Tetratricopeptide repeat protein 17 [Geodia barretti]
MGYESDATAVMQHSLEVNPKLVVNHFTMANLLAARGFAAESASYFEATLQFQPGFEPAAERLQAVRCITLLKHIQMKREKEEKRQREYEAELEKQLYEHRKKLGHFD